jgi:hypothetical protein
MIMEYKKELKSIKNKGMFFVNQAQNNKSVCDYFNKNYKEDEVNLKFTKIGEDLRRISYDKDKI